VPENPCNEIDNLIRSSMENTGILMKRRESLPIKRPKLIPIIAIDDVTGIFTDTGSNIKNENFIN
jgi:hypothetical protein